MSKNPKSPWVLHSISDVILRKNDKICWYSKYSIFHKSIGIRCEIVIQSEEIIFENEKVMD